MSTATSERPDRKRRNVLVLLPLVIFLALAALFMAGLALVVLHILGALRHQFLIRDNLMRRMSPGGVAGGRRCCQRPCLARPVV